ncbi:hypothetical protein BCY88_32920 [Paraburkholderia fungorum]|uniref:Uncharacterized protein n=1 Tax=Paraburkholderia fungorum TaxID=134537 RepID=A0A420G4F0_9BURK|nr:hypothetical protein BCY88_32920 [Paraburkholderia fungorum]
MNIDFAILIQLLFDWARNRAPIFVREQCATHGVLYCKSNARARRSVTQGLCERSTWALLLAHLYDGVEVLHMQHPNMGGDGPRSNDSWLAGGCLPATGPKK